MTDELNLSLLTTRSNVDGEMNADGYQRSASHNVVGMGVYFTR